MQRGILLVNLGSPDSTAVRDVRRYLGEFLMDPYVIDLPWAARRAIVSLFVLPFRPRRTAHAYKYIWTDAGSPLLVHSQALARALARELGLPVALGMRYGNPSLEAAIAALVDAAADEILLVPLYPQHADSTRTTTVVRVREILAGMPRTPALRVLPPFHDDAAFLDALAAHAGRHRAADADYVLFSFHGLPERHIKKADPTGWHCLKSGDCCQTPSPAHATCYRQHCHATARQVAMRLALGQTQWSVAFQSRLGRERWLTPFTDRELIRLPGEGVRRLAVICPAFVADNLETLEEIGVRGREAFLAAGGESLTLVPCLNEDPAWIAALAALCRQPPPPAPFDAPR